MADLRANALRQRTKRRAFCLSVRGFTRLLIREPLAFGTLEDAGGPVGVVHTELDPVVVPEVELGKVAVQVGFAHVLIDAVDAALQDGEEALGSVGVNVAA